MKTSQYPNEELRKKLVLAGIPESEHSFGSLVGKVPTDFDAVSVPSLSPDMLAELLLYFIAKGILTLPIATQNALLDMPWGSHVCQFYSDKADQIKLLVPYFKQGLERNEACVWLVGDLTVEEARNALAAVVPDLDALVAKGQMTFRHFTDLYTDENGSVKSPDLLSDQFAQMEPTVTAKGYTGLRASGNVSWVTNQESMARFMDYETRVNCAIQSARIMAVCTYPARAATLCGCRELIHNHGKIFVQRGEWVHDKTKDAEKIESVFASLAAQ